MSRFLLLRVGLAIAVVGGVATTLPATRVDETIHRLTDRPAMAVVAALVSALPLLVLAQAPLARRLRRTVWMALVAGEVCLAACGTLVVAFDLTFTLGGPLETLPGYTLLLAAHAAAAAFSLYCAWRLVPPVPGPS